MSKSNRFYFIATLFSMLIFVLISCTKEGPQGPPGRDGVDGEDGIDGADGTASCIQCHDDSQHIFGKTLQWESSKHAQGGNFERNTTDCAPCHTSQGFLERMATDTQETSASVNNPNPPNCYTCHNIHDTYGPADWTITYKDPVNLWQPAGNTVTVDLGIGSLCGNCHQARIPEPMPVPGGDSVSIGSPYWGLHHSPVANMIGQTGAYEIGEGYTSSFHAQNVENSCVTCHMATAYGVQSGGHNMSITYEYHGRDVINTAGCIECHADEDALKTKIEQTQDEIDNMLGQLEGILVARGVMDPDYRVVPKKMSADEAGGVINFNFVREDRSHGIHNFQYAKKLLENTITVLQN